MRFWLSFTALTIALGGVVYWQHRAKKPRSAAAVTAVEQPAPPELAPPFPSPSPSPSSGSDLDPPADGTYDRLLPRGPVRPPAPLAMLPLSATVDEARRAAPQFFAAKGFEITLAEWPGVTFGADVVVNRRDQPITYRGANLTLPHSQRAILTRAWGPGTSAVDPFGTPLVVWWNPAEGIRAELDDPTVTFRRYLPVAELLGPGPDLAILPIPVIGKSPDEMLAAYGAKAFRENDLVELRLPPTEWELDWNHTVNRISTRADLVRDGKEVNERITAYSVRIPYPDAAVRQQLLERFQRKWGHSGTPTEEGLRFVDGPVQVFAREDKDSWTVVLQDRSPDD